MDDETPQSVWQGSFSVLGVEVKCHVLSNGQRIIEAESLNALFEAMGTTPPNKQTELEMAEFVRWQKGE